ncbi:MAG: CPBP family intramembrane metalloprotease [Candidatus Goldbacteria bacterium]|nr:CPBP family intramembrane metalloprotease [Candidatus Goldiibacteriota bacterium]
MIKNKPLIYVSSVYLITGLYSLLYLKIPYSTSNFISVMVTSFYMFIPFLCSIFLSKFVYKESVKANINLYFKWTPWYIAAILIPLILAYLSFIIALLIPGVSVDPEMSDLMNRFSKTLNEIQLQKAKEQSEYMKRIFKTEYYYFIIGFINAVIFGSSVNAIFGFGEEAGWRGFLLNALKEKGFYKASLITGTIWGVWHLPLVIQGHNYGKYHIAGIFMMTIWTILLSPLFTYIVHKTGSVIAAAIMHGVLNASPGISIVYLKGGNEITTGITGISGMIALIIINLLIFIYDKYFDENKVINKTI